MKNEVFLDFCIWDFDDITHEEISQLLGIAPSKIYVKGQKIDTKFSRISEKNGWRMNSGLDKYDSFEDQLNAMLNIIEPKTNLVRPFCEKYYCEFSCAIYLRYDNEESTPWVHFNTRYNTLIKELNIEFDLDLYCLPNKKS